MKRTYHILNEDFLDNVFSHMYDKRGTFGCSKTITNEISKLKETDFNYNDILMALEHLERDGYLNLEKKEWEGFPVYRLTYFGFLTFKSDKSGRPYYYFIKEKNWKRFTGKLTPYFIFLNAIAILIITGSQVYFEQKDTFSETQLVSIKSELDKTKIENINLKLKIKNILVKDTLD